MLGKAEQVIDRTNSQQSWIYKNSEGYQTASLTFNQECVLTGAVWLPGSPHEIISLQQALDYFKNSKFVAKKEGWDRQGHFYSDDTHYVDEQNGVTITVNSSEQMVLQIGFSANTIRVAKP